MEEPHSSSFVDGLIFEFGRQAALIARQDRRMARQVDALVRDGITAFTAQGAVIELFECTPTIESGSAPETESSDPMEDFFQRLITLCQQDGTCQKILEELSKLGVTSFTLPQIQFVIKDDVPTDEEDRKTEEDVSEPIDEQPDPRFADAFRRTMEGLGMPDPDLK